METKLHDVFFKKPESKANDFIKMAIEGLKNEEDMVILNSLYELNSHLSLANDAIAEDPNCVVLLKELLVQLDKYYIFPEISISSMQCINHLLDINPRYSSTIVKYKGIKKIVNLTQNIEFIDLAENSIKCIEKLSQENPYVLLEEEAFNAVLSLIDFFDLSLKKSAVKACLYMSKSISSNDQLIKLILPAIPSLTNMTKFNASSELEKSILDTCLQIFYSIFLAIKNYSTEPNNNDIIQSIISHGLIDTLIDVFNNYVKSFSTSEQVADNSSSNIKNISGDSIKTIIKLLQILCNLSVEVTDLIFNMNVLEAIYYLLTKEITSQGSKAGSSSHIVEILALLLSFFPTKKGGKAEKILSEHNKNFYYYFSEKILSYLIRNIISIQSSSTTVQVIKLIELYITYSSNENILVYIDSIKIANICAKMLDSKDSSYILEILNLVDILMTKVPEKYLIIFIREGVSESIKNLISAGSNDIIITQVQNNSISASLYNKYSHYDINNKMDLDEEYNDEEDYEKSETSEKDELNFIEKTEESRKILEKLKEERDLLRKKYEILEKGVIEPTNNINPMSVPIESSILSSAGKFNPNKIETKSMYIINKNSELTSKQDISDVVNMPVSTSKAEIIDKQELSKAFSQPKKFIEYGKDMKETILNETTETIKSINKISKQCLDAYFNDSIINEYIKKLNVKENPCEIIKKLKEITISLNSEVENESQLIQFVSLLKEGLTLYEIEKSGIIEAISNYFDINFKHNYNKIINDDNKPIKCINEHNKHIIQKLQLFYKAFNFPQTSNDLNTFISIIQNSITSMNCFKLLIYDTKISTYNTYASTIKNQIYKYKIKLLFHEIQPELVCSLSDYSLMVLEKIEGHLQTNKILYLIMDSNDIFGNIKESIINNIEKELLLLKPTTTTVVNNITSAEPETLDNKASNFESFMNEIIKNRKGSEDDYMVAEKFLKHMIKRKSSSHSEPPEAKENEFHKVISTDDYQIGRKEFIEKLDIVYFFEIGDKKIIIDHDWTISDFMKELKSNLTNKEYNNYGKEVIIKFEFKAQHNAVVAETKYNNEIKMTEFDNNNKMHVNYQSYIENEFVNNYDKLVVNNESLYLIKRVCPFVYLLSLIDLSLSIFPKLFITSTTEPNLFNREVLENTKVTSLILKQSKDPFTISSGQVPKWCFELCSSFNFICGFSSRYLLFKTTSFDQQRSMRNLYIYLRNFMGENIPNDSINLNQTSKNRVLVKRSEILISLASITNKNNKASNKGYIDFEFEGEVGTGLGPTLEFYSCCFKEFVNLKFNGTSIWMKSHDRSLYPMPLSRNLDSESDNEVLNTFKLLGFLIARAIYDDRLIDFPLSSIFWDIILERPVTLSKYLKIDPFVFKVLEDLSYITNKNTNLRRQLSELGVSFILPGYSNFELKGNGDEITLEESNLDEYLMLVSDALFGSGTKPLANYFKQGFEKVFPIKYLKCFNSLELEEIICGSNQEQWSSELLENNILTNHGYNKSSKTLSFLIKFLLSLDSIERKAFILFVTGCPRLPIGGIKNLNPKLTIVKKQPDVLNENPDKYLPTVMTCYNYLKLPDYSSFEVFNKNMRVAMFEGSNSFNLS